MNIDIILINETHLKPAHSLKLTNNHTYRSDLPSIRGSPAHCGMVVLVHRRIIHQLIPLKTNSIQSTSIKIKTNNIEVQISALYKSSNTKLDLKNVDIITKNAE